MNQTGKNPKLKVPFISDKDLSKRAIEFLQKHGHFNQVPVDIEKICDEIGVSILPLPRLHKDFGIDAYIADSMSVIVVDQYCFENNIARVRFSIAHELSHSLLHKDIFDQFHISDIEAYKQFQDTIGAEIESRIEAQAYVMAGCLLMPEPLLRAEIDARVTRLGSVSNISVNDAFAIVREVAELFNVSAEAFLRQLKKSYPEFFARVMSGSI